MTRFFDTNVLVYAYSNDPRKTKARELLNQLPAISGYISVQVLNELTNVLRRKMGLDWIETGRVLDNVRKIFGKARPLTEATHDQAISICRDHGLAFYDGLIVAAALEAGCDELLSEDLQHGRAFGNLKIVNPFL